MTEHELIQRWLNAVGMVEALGAIVTCKYDMVYYNEKKALTCYYDHVFKLMKYEGIVKDDDRSILDQAISRAEKELEDINERFFKD